MYCNYCGKVIQDDANVCAYCGVRVSAVTARKRLCVRGQTAKLRACAPDLPSTLTSTSPWFAWFGYLLR